MWIGSIVSSPEGEIKQHYTLPPGRVAEELATRRGGTCNTERKLLLLGKLPLPEVSSLDFDPPKGG